MKWVIVVIIGLAGGLAWHLHEKHAEEQLLAATEEARVAAETRVSEKAKRDAAAASERLKQEQERTARLLNWREEERQRQAAMELEMAKARMPSMAVAKILEPYVQEVFAPLDLEKPEDFVPKLEITKERILDKKAQAEPGRVPVYERAKEAFDALIAVAEMRTQALEEALSSRARGGSSLNQPIGNETYSSTAWQKPVPVTSSMEFFMQGMVKRSNEKIAQYKPTVGQRLEALRAAERAWNAQVRPHASPEYYDIPYFKPMMVKADEIAVGSSTNNGPSPARFRLRKVYYDSYGYRHSY